MDNSIEAEAYNYIITADVIMFSKVKDFLIKKGGLELAESRATELFEEVSAHRLTRHSFNSFCKYFTPLKRIEHTIKVRTASRVNWDKVKLPKMGDSDGMVRFKLQK